MSDASLRLIYIVFIIPTFIILVGGVCTGKSTYAKEFLSENPDYILIEADEIFSEYGDSEESKEKAQNKIKDILLGNFEKGNNIIYDGVNLIKNNRLKYKSWAKKWSYTVKVVDFGSRNFDLLKQRIEKDNSYKWKEQSMYDDAIYQMPSSDEGYDEIIIKWKRSC